MLYTLLFYFFSFLTLSSGVMVISVKNPVHAVLFLIFTFFNAAGLFLLLGAEFVAMLLVIVYVGAVAVLFLFVVMMMDINFVALKQGFLRYLPLGLVIAIILFADLFFMLKVSYHAADKAMVASHFPIQHVTKITNTHAIGEIVYTHYLYPFQLAGIVLLVAMIGSIVLTLRRREGVKKQQMGKQVACHREDAVELVQVKIGAGIDGKR